MGFSSTDLRNNLIKLVAAGLGLMLLSSKDFQFSRGREVDADDLQQALAEGRVGDTWVH